MKERARELKRKNGNGEQEVLEKIAAMPEPYRDITERLHALIREAAPGLSPRTWYGMPAYSDRNGKTILFFRSGHMFKERYMTFGFNQEARLDEGDMWPIAFALTALGAAEEKRIAELVQQAIG